MIVHFYFLAVIHHSLSLVCVLCLTFGVTYHFNQLSGALQRGLLDTWRGDILCFGLGFTNLLFHLFILLLVSRSQFLYMHYDDTVYQASSNSNDSFSCLRNVHNWSKIWMLFIYRRLYVHWRGSLLEKSSGYSVMLLMSVDVF